MQFFLCTAVQKNTVKIVYFAGMNKVKCYQLYFCFWYCFKFDLNELSSINYVISIES